MLEGCWTCVVERLMKASHLEDRSEDGGKPECYQRDQNDLWELKHQCSLPLRKFPLISHCSPQALGYPATWFSPIDVDTQRRQMWRGVTDENGMEVEDENIKGLSRQKSQPYSQPPHSCEN
ncbi:hypothetical protein PFLUV_G00029660 [Perca fluviatilis]|uniref:Uncharacterized protein n=1 Tax=Perca fluviatilis TaxID=8168 RepID=A0A6A5ETG8_PERFL|nr:hypothetical protein PFLUV_G00029660 [Perca fluviatilis]